jgi:hypothetical protein
MRPGGDGPDYGPTPPHLLGRVLANVYGGVGVAAAVGYHSSTPDNQGGEERRP